MTDSPFFKKRGVFVKTYSKVRPLQTFRPDFPPSKYTGNTSPAIQSTSPFRCVLTPSIAPTLAPANSPSSDSSNSEHLDIEMIPSEVDKSATEEEDEKTFVTLTPGAKKSKKTDTKKKSSTPLQNISNFINERHSNKVVPKRTGAPFMWPCTKSRPRAQLDSIQESDLESSSGDESECVTDTRGKQKAAGSKRKTDAKNAARDPKDVEMKDCHERRVGVKKNRPHDKFLQPRGKLHLPIFVQGRGVFSSPQCRRGKEPSSSQLMGSTTSYTDSFSAAAYTGENEVTSDDSTLMMSDDTGSRYSTTEDTPMEEDYSDIEILRDVPDPAVRVMKQLTPKVAHLFLPNASMATQRKNAVNTTKAMPRKVSSAWLNKKPVTGRKNSTLAEDVSALNIQEYDPIQEISAIKEDNSRVNFASGKMTSTPTSKDRNTVIHHRFMPDTSSIDGDACALPTIEAMPSLSLSLFSESSKAPSSNQRPGVKKSLDPAEKSPQKPASTPRSVKLSSTSRSMSTPLGIQGKKAQTLERSSPKMSPRIFLRQYPKSASSSVRKNTAMVSTGSVSRNSSSSKQVKFLLSTKVREIFSEPDSVVPCAVIHIPELCPSPSILKKTHSFETSKNQDTLRTLTSKESRVVGARLTSTPQRPSRKSKGAHMLALSFDVSAVDLPSCSDDDLVINTPKQPKVETTSNVTHQEKASSTLAAGQCTQELIDFDPEPFQVSTSMTNESLKPTTSTPEEVQQGTQHPVHATPRGQLKRSSPSSGLPGKPNKKRILDKWKLEVSNQLTPVVSPPQTCDRATQKNPPSQKKRLEFADKAVGLPECIISRLGPTPLKPAKFWQYVSNDVKDYETIKNMPQDVMETIPDAVFS